ncbi:hypothetical protein GGR51DRAFT_561337 [Nemania sp. FL0031]|nr:hypothetical protein GGR51DRAFT_561337 [Nemania sp. FL0031]
MSPQDDNEPVGFSGDPMGPVSFNMSPLQPNNVDLNEWPGFGSDPPSFDLSSMPIPDLPQFDIIRSSSPAATKASSLHIWFLKNQWKSPSSTVAATIMEAIRNAAQNDPGCSTNLDPWGLANELLNGMKRVYEQGSQTALIFTLESLLLAPPCPGEYLTNPSNDVPNSVANEARFYGRLVASAINGFPDFRNVPGHGVLTLLGKNITTVFSLMQILKAETTPLTKSLAENLFTAALEHDNSSIIEFLLGTQLVDANDSICWFNLGRYTPLELASETGSLKSVELLIQRRVDVNKCFSGRRTALRKLIESWPFSSTFDNSFLDLVDRFLKEGAIVCDDILDQALRRVDPRLAIRLVEHVASQRLRESTAKKCNIARAIIRSCKKPDAEKMLKILIEAWQKTDDNGMRYGPDIIDILLFHGRHEKGGVFQFGVKDEEFEALGETEEAMPNHSTICVLGKSLTQAINKDDQHSAAAILDHEPEFVGDIMSCCDVDDESCFKPAIALEAALDHGFDDIAWGIVASGINWADSSATSFLDVTIRKRKLNLSRAIIESSSFIAHSEDLLYSILDKAIELDSSSVIDSLPPSALYNDGTSTQGYLEVMGRMDLFWGLLEVVGYQAGLRFAISRQNTELLDESITRGARLDDEIALEMVLGTYSSMARPFLERYRKAYPQGLSNFGRSQIEKILEKYSTASKSLDILFEFGIVDNIARIPQRLKHTPLTKALMWLHGGTEDCKYSLIKRLIDSGSELNNVSVGGETLISLAIRFMASKSVVQLLIERGAEINKQARFGITFTPLQTAAERNNLEIVELLLENGADPNSPPAEFKGATALQFAAIHGNCQMAIMLMEYGAKLNVPPPKGPRGRWPLEGAAEAGRIDMIKLLWDTHNGPFDDSQCRMAMRLAERNGHIGCRDFIQELMETSPSI